MPGQCEAVVDGLPCGEAAAYKTYARCPDCGTENTGRDICTKHAAALRAGQLRRGARHLTCTSDYVTVRITTWTPS